MPTPQQILSGLTDIANGALPLAIAWHVVLLFVLMALVRGWRPRRRLAAATLSLPLISVAALALWHANPFNGAVFLLLALALGALALPMPPAAPPRPPPWAIVVGVVLVVFGWVYPHFLEQRPAWHYLFAAPLGLVPCPTLSVVIGLGLLAGGFGSRPWVLLLAAAGVFYGVFGAWRLGVWIDGVLLAGAAALLVLAWAMPRPPRTAGSPPPAG
jgi:hypothetical protein